MVQKIGGETELPDDDKIRHHIHNQRGDSVFVSTEDYSLGDSNEDFEVSEESFIEMASLFRSWTHLSSMLL